MSMLALILSQSDPVVSSGLSGILTAMNLGLAGLGLLAFVKGWIVPGKTYEEALDREKAAREELDLMRKNLTEQVIPELGRSRTVQQALGQLVERVMDFVEQEESRRTQ